MALLQRTRLSYAYGPTDENYDKAPFNFMGVVIPPVAEKNILIDYTVEVEEQ